MTKKKLNQRRAMTRTAPKRKTVVSSLDLQTALYGSKAVRSITRRNSNGLNNSLASLSGLSR